MRKYVKKSYSILKKSEKCMLVNVYRYHLKGFPELLYSTGSNCTNTSCRHGTGTGTVITKKKRRTEVKFS